MEITTDMVIFVMVFVTGVISGVYIMTQIDNKRERELYTQLKELECNINQLRNLKDAYKNNQCTCKNKDHELR